MITRRIFLLFILLFIIPAAFAEKKVLNIYAWMGELPASVIKQFEKETGIEVNLSTFENNEIMYAKLRALKNAGYDLVNPSSYYVDRMRRQNMLVQLDKTRLSNFKNINPLFLQAAYDPGSAYSVPHLLGMTGIFVNTEYHAANSLKRWSDLWHKRFHGQVMMLDDARELFSMALLTLGYSVNDRNPEHLKAAFLQLKSLMPNIKVFTSEAATSIMIDEDATLGMAWNGEAFKAAQENPHLQFIFPQEGFVIWVDTLVIPLNAPHKDHAYLFLNFILRPEIAKQIALLTHYSTANLAGQKLLPANIRNNPMIYPPKHIMQRGQFQTDLGDDTLALLEKYWEELKMNG